ncbi:hypothetical protein AVEN_223780-1 [Araneus ventricosus]|uniref:Uncharacterized protein n=1 Tax=Araneus ventricosus TaxID=182803 RepID=A0A4Y2DK79_ARAVE|nr:hypothetical protein AVEN_223780-1 [Araneus ventricosus]
MMGDENSRASRERGGGERWKRMENEDSGGERDNLTDDELKHAVVAFPSSPAKHLFSFRLLTYLGSNPLVAQETPKPGIFPPPHCFPVCFGDVFPLAKSKTKKKRLATSNTYPGQIAATFSSTDSAVHADRINTTVYTKLPGAEPYIRQAVHTRAETTPKTPSTRRSSQATPQIFILNFLDTPAHPVFCHQPYRLLF